MASRTGRVWRAWLLREASSRVALYISKLGDGILMRFHTLDFESWRGLPGRNPLRGITLHAAASVKLPCSCLCHMKWYHNIVSPQHSRPDTCLTQVRALAATGMLESEFLVRELGSVSVDLETLPELTAAENATPDHS